MAADSRNATSEMLISRRPKKNRKHVNSIAVTGYRDPIIANTPNTSPISVKPKTEPVAAEMLTRKVPVLYYLTRNGHLEHPHLIDVPLSSPHGLYLRDVVNTLNYHRGRGIANMYSWSYKRSYKNGYVWHDLSEDDFIESTNGRDYVLKGSELLETHASQKSSETNHTGEDCTAAAAVAVMKRRNQSWSSFDNPQEYMVVKCESSRELAAKFAADAATQTEEQRRRQSFGEERKEHVMMTLGREETPSPPPSNSSSEVSEGVSGRKYGDPTVEVRGRNLTVEDQHEGSGRMKASEVLMQLITCGVHKSILD